MWDLELFTSFILSQLLLASASQLFNPEFLNFRLWLYILGAKKKKEQELPEILLLCNYYVASWNGQG